MKSKYIFSCILGGTFFSIPYLALGINAIPSVAIGLAAYGAGILIFKDKSKIDISDKFNENDRKMLEEAKKSMTELQRISNQLENEEIVKNTKHILSTSNKILDTIINKPEKLKKARNFLSYYLPITIKILTRYDEIENQKMNTTETKKFMTSVEGMIVKIRKAFEEQLSNIYQSEMVDTDAELKVFETMLKSDGFIEDMNFNIENKE